MFQGNGLLNETLFTFLALQTPGTPKIILAFQIGFVEGSVQQYQHASL